MGMLHSIYYFNILVQKTFISVTQAIKWRNRGFACYSMFLTWMSMSK